MKEESSCYHREIRFDLTHSYYLHPRSSNDVTSDTTTMFLNDVRLDGSKQMM